MFGWFSPQCPLNTQEKTWTEFRMRWLVQQLGIERLLRAEVILPTEEYFPDPYRGTLEDARRIMQRLCGYMGVDPHKLQLELFSDQLHPRSLGIYDGENRRVWAAESLLADPQALAATLAHELAHDILLGGGLLTTAEPDCEEVTDLLPVFLGVGIFGANATIYEQTRWQGRLSWWTLGKRGYLPARIHGYGFALFAFLRGEDNPAWAEHLRLDAAVPLKEGLRYLRRTGDSLCHPDTINDRRVPSQHEMLQRLQEGTPTVRLATLWEMEKQGCLPAEAIAILRQRLRDRDPYIRHQVGRVLAAAGSAAAAALPELVEALSRSCSLTQSGAVLALGSLRLKPDVVVPELCELLRQPDCKVQADVAWALGQFGPAAEQAVPPLLAVFKRSLVGCQGPPAETVAQTLLAITDHPEQAVRKQFADDSEIVRLALATLRTERRQAPADSEPEPIHTEQ
jgi:hypothetical protein